MLRKMQSADIKNWVKSVQPMLDNPEVWTPDMNCKIQDWEEKPDAIKFCFLSLVEYSAFIANMGVAILYEELNFNNDGFIAERAYYPEPKLRRRMVKEKIPLFSKETFHPVKDFDVVGFSAYYPLQFAGVPDVLEMSGMKYLSSEREESDPIVFMGGVAAFNPSPVHKFIDVFFLGDGENLFREALVKIKELKQEGKSKRDILYHLQTTIRGIYVPQFYEERYFPADHPTNPNQVEGHYPIVEGVPKKIRKAVAEISQIYPLTRMFVSNSEGSEMSMASLEITRGCGQKSFARGSLVSTSKGLKPIEEVTSEDLVLAYNKHGEQVLTKTSGGVCTGKKEIREYKVGNSTKTLKCTPDHRIALSGFDGSEGNHSYEEAATIAERNSSLFTPKVKIGDFDFDSFLLAVIGADFSLTRGPKNPTHYECSLKQLSSKPCMKFFVENNLFSSKRIGLTEKGEEWTRLRFSPESNVGSFAMRTFGLCRSENKNPKFELTPETASSFVFGLMCTDMSIRNHKGFTKVMFGSSSREFSEFIINSLYLCGIQASRGLWENGKNSKIYRVNVSSESVSKLKEIADHYKHIIDINFSPKLKDSYRRVSLSEVRSLGVQEVWDIETPEHLNFVVDGVLVHNCQFCEGSFRSQPYRERPLDVIKDAFPKLIKNVGAQAVTPYGFNLSDHHRINDILYFLLEDEDRKVSMSSQHIDHFTEELARIAYESGNRSLTLAVEAPTQRMRDKIGKNLTEEKILEVFDIVFRVGFNKVKIYMIANLPEETQEDIDYLPVLAKKIWDLQNEIQGDYHKTNIRFSWTPFNGKAHTPLQWAKTCDIGEDGLPIMPKTLGKTLEGLRELGYGFRVGTDSELSIINQCFSFGDRRMADVIEEAYHNPKFKYRGGMSIGFKKPLEEFHKILKNHGLDYEFITREKDENQVFSWDFINMGVTKKFLHDAYFNNYKKAINLTRCQEDCMKCGGCTPISKELFKSYWEKKLPKGRGDVLLMLQKRFKKQTVSKLRFKIFVEPEYRYVHASKIKNYIRRAFLRIDAPIRNKITLASDKLKFNDWTYGYDYGEMLLYTKDFDMTDICERLNATFEDTPILRFLSVDKFTDSVGSFCNAYDKILYSFKVPKKDYTFFFINKSLKAALDSEEYVIKMKVLGEKRDTTKVIDYDARGEIVDLWCVDRNDYTEAYALLKENVGVYELFPKVFSTSKRNILKYEVMKEVYTLPDVAEDSFDMFADVCEECGRAIESDVLGDQVHDSLCIRCSRNHPEESLTAS